MKRFAQIFIALILIAVFTAEVFTYSIYAADGNSGTDAAALEIAYDGSGDAAEGDGQETSITGDDTVDASGDTDRYGTDDETVTDVDLSGESEEETDVVDLGLMQDGGLPLESVDVSGMVSEEGVSLQQYVENAIDSRAESIDLSGFDLQPEEAAAAIAEVINHNPRYFFLSGEDVPVTYDAETGIVSEVGLIYTMDEKQISRRQKVIDDELADIRAFADAAPDGELDKVLAIHEYFCLNYCYDDDLAIFSVDELMMYKQGVCQAFALAFELACSELGIESGYAAGYRGAGQNGHAWNSVMVDGQWYMIDTTWDSQSCVAGYVSRTHLLKSPDVFGQGHERTYTYNYTYTGGEAVDTTYDSYWWAGIAANAGLYPLGGSWYYLRNYGSVREPDYRIEKIDSAYTDENAEDVFAGNEEVTVGSAMCVYNGRIWFSGKGTEDSSFCNIYSMAPDGTGLVLEYTEPGISNYYGTVTYRDVRGLGELYGTLHYSTYVTTLGSTYLYYNQPVSLTGGIEIFAEGLSITPEELTMTEDTVQLTAVFEPENATVREVYWKSSDNSVATVDGNGLVTAVGYGTAVITAVTATGNHKAKASITVPQAEEIGYNSVYIYEVSETEARLFWTPAENASRYYVYQIIDDNNSQTGYKYNGYVLAAVTEEYGVDIERKDPEDTPVYCVVAANENGRTKGYYTTEKQEDRNVIVNDPRVTWRAGANAVKNLACTQGTAGFKVGEVHPAGMNKADISFTGVEGADAYRVYKIDLDSDGNMLPGKAKVYGLSSNTSRTGFEINPVGGAIFFVEAYNGTDKISNMCEPVELFPEGIAFYDVPEELYIGEEYQATVQMLPDGTEVSPDELTWRTADKEVFTVAADGTLTGIGEGTARLYVYTNDKAYGVMTSVTVYSVPAEGIKISKKKLTLDVNKTATLKATVFPANATNKNVIWDSSNTAVAKVSSKGKVTAKKAGTAKITVTTEDGDYTASCVVTVKQPAESVKITNIKNSCLTLKKGKTYTLKAAVAPADTTNKKVKWSSSDSTVVSVTSAGKLKARKVGKATITVKAVSGDSKCIAVCEVTVKAK